VTDSAELRARAAARVAEMTTQLLELSHSLHAEPELAFSERRSAAKLAALMEATGFEVERNACDLPTALIATYGTGDLTVGICAEYDALPGIGHACGHNIICASGAGAAIALAAVADDAGFRVKLLGTPAEESGGGKILMLERGAFDDVTFAMMVHPGRDDEADPNLSSSASTRLTLIFRGHAAHAAAPHLGRNAADAAVVGQVALGLLRQQLPDGYRVAAIVADGGERTNIIPERAIVECEARTPTAEELSALKERVLDCFRGAALATGCTLEAEQPRPDYLDLRDDPWLMTAFGRNLQATGRTLPEPSPARIHFPASTDMGNVTHALPGIHPSIGVLGAEGEPHTRQFAADSASEAADTAIIDAATALAWTALDVTTDPERTARYIAARRTPGGAAGPGRTRC
jgi:amidohydrolase